MEEDLLRQYTAQLKVNIQLGRLATTPPSWKESNQIINHSKLYYIVEGEGIIKINDELLHPHPGDFIYIPEGSCVSYESIPGKPIRKYWCHARIKLGVTLLSEVLNFPHCTHVGEDLWLREKFETMLSYHNSKDAFAPIMTQGLFMEIFYYYVKLFNDDQIIIKKSITHTNLNDILSYMDENLQNKVTLKQLADIINVHPNYLIHLFKSQFSMPPIDYLNLLRLDKAKELLELRLYSIREISEMCGFSSQYYFSNVFKKSTGLSPTGYKQSVIKEK